MTTRRVFYPGFGWSVQGWSVDRQKWYHLRWER